MEISSRDGNIRPLYLPPKKFVRQVKKQQLESDMKQWTGSKLGKEYDKSVYSHLIYLFNLYAEYIMQNAKLDEAQAGIKIAGWNINNLRYADENNPYGRKQRGTKEPLDESERGRVKMLA